MSTCGGPATRHLLPRGLSSGAWFGDTTFSGGAMLDAATFSGDAWFDGARFEAGAELESATVTDAAAGWRIEPSGGTAGRFVRPSAPINGPEHLPPQIGRALVAIAEDLADLGLNGADRARLDVCLTVFR
ncbi:pentapeptide repeat-containing protein [Actinomadura opuntiae]|uniref:pentapeptide repeat-containing protein n=1 Tax=Actinomadura sp. OS1-43 TaxID=604315 RepID=UPI00255B2103|nr:pentapeptide repeat-containing protein [Actinomadura sp. OS1-43]MDL4816769.1 pentapeptide repeat-containing protein [Actinomadura sp. OS1-43]